MSQDYEVRSDGRGGFRVSLITSGGAIAVVALIILAIIAQKNPSGKAPEEETYSTTAVQTTGYAETTGTATEVIPAETGIHELHVLGEVGFPGFYKEDTQNAYGQTFSGPYLSIWSPSSDENDAGSKGKYANIELVTNKQYQFFSGTLFVDADAPEDMITELFVYADDELVYRSGSINRRTQPIDLNINIQNCHVLRIETVTPYYYFGCIIVNGKVSN